MLYTNALTSIDFPMIPAAHSKKLSKEKVSRNGCTGETLFALMFMESFDGVVNWGQAWKDDRGLSLPIKTLKELYDYDFSHHKLVFVSPRKIFKDERTMRFFKSWQRRGVSFVFFAKADTSQPWFHDFVLTASEIFFLDKRVTFYDAKASELRNAVLVRYFGEIIKPDNQ